MIVFNPLIIKTLINEKRNSDKSFRQVDFLKEVKLSLPGLNNILEGKSYPGVDTLIRIANYFKKDMNYFFDSFDQTQNGGIVSSPPAEYYKVDNNYKALYEMQKEINEIIKENADLRVENERLKNGIAPMTGAKTG